MKNSGWLLLLSCVILSCTTQTANEPIKTQPEELEHEEVVQTVHPTPIVEEQIDWEEFKQEPQTQPELVGAQEMSKETKDLLLLTSGGNWEFNTDSQLNSVRLQIEKELSQYQLLLDENDLLEVKCSSDGKLCVYAFNYYSGGTRGDINNPIIQYKKEDGSYLVESLFESGNVKGKPLYMESLTDRIYKLPSEDQDLYLIMGEETMDRNVYRYNALVVEITEDKIRIDYPAFMDSSSYVICNHEVPAGNTQMVYDEKEHIFKIVYIGANDNVSYKNLTEPGYVDIECSDKAVFTFKNDRFIFSEE